MSSSTAEADTMFQRIRGFYKSAGTSARITHIVGTGGNNQTEKITVQSSQKTINIGPPPNSNDPFPQTSPNSDRSWANPTYDLSVPTQFGNTDPILRRYRDDNGQREQYESGCVSSLGRHNLQYRKLRTWITTGSPMAWRMLPVRTQGPRWRGAPESPRDGGELHVLAAPSRVSPIRISSLNTTRCMLTRAQPTGQRTHRIPIHQQLVTISTTLRAARTRLAIITSRRRRS